MSWFSHGHRSGRWRPVSHTSANPDLGTYTSPQPQACGGPQAHSSAQSQAPVFTITPWNSEGDPYCPQLTEQENRGSDREGDSAVGSTGRIGAQFPNLSPRLSST